MRILVTGSNGFIGRHVVQALLNNNDEVGALDIPGNGSFFHGAENFGCDLLDATLLRSIVERFRPEVVVHLAARTDLFEKTKLSGYAANIDGVQNLLQAIATTPSVRRVLVTSSQLVCKVGHVPDDENEYCPDTLYGESKVQTERLVRDSDGSGREWVLLRPTTVWGPGMSAHYQRFLDMIRTGRYFHVGHVPLLKSYSYIGNIVYQYLRFITAPHQEINRRTFYLADYQPINLIDWANHLQEEMDAPPIRTVPLMVARTAAALGDVINAIGLRGFPFTTFRLNNVMTQYVFDLTSTQGIVGALPFDMKAGVQATVQWYLQQRRQV